MRYQGTLCGFEAFPKQMIGHQRRARPALGGPKLCSMTTFRPWRNPAQNGEPLPEHPLVPDEGGFWGLKMVVRYLLKKVPREILGLVGFRGNHHVREPLLSETSPWRMGASQNREAQKRVQQKCPHEGFCTQFGVEGETHASLTRMRKRAKPLLGAERHRHCVRQAVGA